jgi:hypothetical protein
MKKFFTQIFQDERGNFSSNRFVGIMCSISLCLTLHNSQFSTSTVDISPILIQSVAALAFGSLGLGAANKIFAKKQDS